jgi:hypothetical protein
MIRLSRFSPSKNKKPEHFLVSPDVPQFWGGYYAIFEPKDKSGLWTKMWFASDKGKTISRAFATIQVEQSQPLWNKFIYS